MQKIYVLNYFIDALYIVPFDQSTKASYSIERNEFDSSVRVLAAFRSVIWAAINDFSTSSVAIFRAGLNGPNTSYGCKNLEFNLRLPG